MSLFGDELRRLRRRSGLSQETLAARAGLSTEAVSLLERGRRTPRLTTMRLLADGMSLPEGDRPAFFATVNLFPDASPTLPTFSDPTIGREGEIAALAELLGRDDCRLVTLFGPAGVGKTRIAVAYAGSAASSYPDGVHWLPIGGLDDPESVITAISGALGVRAPAPGGTGEIVDHLRHQSCLMIIDNAEHQLPTCVAIGRALLAEAPGVKIIFTSRHLTGIAAEQPLPVNPLPVPALGLSPEDVIMAPAAELFWNRTGVVGMPGRAQADAVARICQRVDRLPLALEIAAARTTVLSIGELADSLEAELSILQLSGPHGDEALADAMVGWSHELLTPKEKLVFAQLAVFGGSFDREAVAAVCGAGLSEVETVDVLSSLVSKSLVARRDDGSPHARFRLLRLVRQYARAQLDRQDRTEELRRRHAEYFCALVEQAAPHLTTHDQQSWLAALDRDLDNLRDAISWSLQHQPELAYRIIAALDRWCYLHGRYADGRAWAAGALQAWPDAPARLRTPVLQLAGTLAFLQCDYAAATSLMTEARRLYVAADDHPGIVWCTSRLGSIAREQGRYAESEQLHSEALRLAGAADDQHQIATQLNYLSFLTWLRGDPVAAEPLAREALDRTRGAGDREGVIWALINLGTAARYRGDLGSGELLLRQCLDLGEELNFPEGIAWATNQLGVIARLRGESERAVGLQQASLAEHHELGDRWREASVHDELAALALAAGDALRAARELAAADRLRQEIDAPVPAAEQADRTRTVEAARQQLGSVFDVAGLTTGL
jgi:predicted ATPase/DNA-binding XRE family transcriptional regulator